MATKSKKTTKKSTKKIRLKKTSRTPFNKKNAIEFGRQLYNETNKQITYMKLACEALEDDELHCVIGAAYGKFVNSQLKDVFNLASTTYYKSCNPYELNSGDSATILAISKLVAVAVLKNKSISKLKLARALEEVVNENDSNFGEDDSEFLERAYQVAKVWDKEIVPLLK